MGDVRKWNEILRNERESRSWTQAQVANALRTDPKRVSEWEVGKTKPGYRYRRMLMKLFGKNAEELGFLTHEFDNEVLDENSHQYTKVTDILPQETSIAQPDIPNTASLPQPIQLLISGGAPVYITIQVREQTPAQLYDESRTFVPVDEQPHAAAYSSHEDTTIPTTGSGSEAVKRRDFFRETGRVIVGGAAFLASRDILSDELLDRFHRALEKPSTVDTRMLTYLQTHAEGYWRDHYHASLVSSDLLDYVREHFQRIVKLLDGPMLPTARIRLCSTASETALLVGTLLFDLADYIHSREYFRASIRAAQEANHHTLQAVGWGWMSLSWTYGGNLQEALVCIQTARSLAVLSDSITVRTWLAAIDAEAQAKLHNYDACRKSLDEAERIEDSERAEQVHYWTSYDRVQFEGYEGTCYRLLYQHGNVRTYAYLTNAQLALKRALTETDPVVARLQSVFLSDLAGTYVQQKEIEEACRLAQEALQVNAPQSQMVVQRVLALRQELEQWKNLQDVKNLDAHLMPLLTKSKLN